MKGLLVLSTIFFLAINTLYFWEGNLGSWLIPLTLFLLILYIVLIIALFNQIRLSVMEKFVVKSRLLVIVFLTFVLVSTAIRPFGIIDFKKFERDNLLVAQREGVANCTVTLKLKDNMTFVQRNICFGITDTKGKYHLKNDTIYFDNMEPGRHETIFYEFAIVTRPRPVKPEKYTHLTLYKNATDTSGLELVITKNELHKIKLKIQN